MSPRKLSESDKHEILKLYRHSPETTSTLASRYGVSSSTISRFLKSRLPEQEYEALIQQKRIGRPSSNTDFDVDLAIEQSVESEMETPASTSGISLRQSEPAASTPAAMSTSQVTAASRAIPDIPAATDEILQELIESGEEPDESEVTVLDDPPQSGPDWAEVSVLEEMLGEDLTDLDEDRDDDDDDDDDLDDGVEDEWEDDAAYAPLSDREPRLRAIRSANVQVLPLSEASLTKTCYLVVDRAAELISRPLKDFSDLGKIPLEEVLQKTLPVFDNHRVARRFSNRAQRVIKVPDGRMLQKTSSHLEAKGITRLLIDGQVYSLSE